MTSQPSQPFAVSPQELADALTRGTTDTGPGYAAAIALIVNHESWLYRVDFRAYIFSDEDEEGGDPRISTINFRRVSKDVEAGRLIASSSERTILRIAASMAVGTKVDLTALFSLGRVNRASVISALALMLEVPAGTVNA